MSDTMFWPSVAGHLCLANRRREPAACSAIANITDVAAWPAVTGPLPRVSRPYTEDGYWTFDGR